MEKPLDRKLRELLLESLNFNRHNDDNYCNKLLYNNKSSHATYIIRVKLQVM